MAAEEKPGQLVAAKGVGAEQIDSFVAGSKEMEARAEEAQQAIWSTSHEKLQRAGLCGVLDVLVKRAGTESRCIDEGSQVQVFLPIHHVQVHRRQVRIYAILFDRIIRRKKAGAEDYAVQAAEDEEPEYDFAATAHREELSVRIRGSTQ